MTVSIEISVNLTNEFHREEEKALQWSIDRNDKTRRRVWDSMACDCLTDGGSRFLVQGASGDTWFYEVLSTSDGSHFEVEYSGGGDAYDLCCYDSDVFSPVTVEHWKEYFSGTRQLDHRVAADADS